MRADRRALGPYANHADAGIEALDRDGDPRRQAAAAHRHENGLDLRALLDDLEADCALAGHDVRVIERDG